MTVSVKVLTAPLVKKDVLADLYGLIGLIIGYPLELQDGAPVPAILDGVVGLLVDDLWNPFVVPALRAVFLDYATGDWLGLIAWLLYNRSRILSQAATVTLVVENHAGVFSGTIAVGQVRVKSAVSGKTYTNTNSGSIAAYSSGIFPVPPSPLAAYQVALVFEADEAGTASNAGIGDIATTPVSAPSGVFVQTNASPATGSDVEEDPNLVLRARAAVASRSVGGPRKAYLDAALDPVTAFTSRGLAAPASWGTGNPAIFRIRIQEPGNSTVLVWCASKTGPSGGTAGDVTTDVGKANLAIQMFVVPPGTTCTVAAAIQQNLALSVITLDVSAESQVTVDEATATATAALDTFFSTLPVGGARDVASPTQGYVFRSAVLGILVGTDAPGVKNAKIPAMPSDVSVGGNAVVVQSYSIVVNIVSQGAEG